jgi:hypothetical protein
MAHQLHRTSQTSTFPDAVAQCASREASLLLLVFDCDEIARLDSDLVQFAASQRPLNVCIRQRFQFLAFQHSAVVNLFFWVFQSVLFRPISVASRA